MIKIWAVVRQSGLFSLLFRFWKNDTVLSKCTLNTNCVTDFSVVWIGYRGKYFPFWKSFEFCNALYICFEIKVVCSTSHSGGNQVDGLLPAPSFDIKNCIQNLFLLCCRGVRCFKNYILMFCIRWKQWEGSEDRKMKFKAGG